MLVTGAVLQTTIANSQPNEVRAATVMNSKQQAVVNLAKAQLGKPYEWAAKGPNSFDCSGLVQYVYKKCCRYVGPSTNNNSGTYGD
ncbi:C40 family peptidase [Lapidilactobacillus wuchangensis]|uniref:C40 family peptidase n=1 Tax=Lapidilactobacillus wuchangensis TaxID=2486001 RepID=UPI002989B2B5|nr:NlpC/P60 family protein [Lapidilactobacillus wuchangensis]